MRRLRFFRYQSQLSSEWSKEFFQDDRIAECHIGIIYCLQISHCRMSHRH